MIKDLANGHFFNPTKGPLKADQVISEILGYMTEKPEKFYDIIVGCDSPSSEEPHFPVAIVVLRKREGGRFFLKKVNYSSGKKFSNWKMRILEEVLLSCELALFLRENLEKAVKKLSSLPNYEFRYIHADVGENGATKDMVKELTGLIRGNGFEPKIKPEAYAASNVADRYT